MDKFNTLETKVKKSYFGINIEKMRLDILLTLYFQFNKAVHLFEMNKIVHLNLIRFIIQIKKIKVIIEQIINDFPLVIVKIGFIGYKDFEDLELEEQILLFN